MNYKLTTAGIDIEIDLEPGIYRFYPDSATGKTRLFGLLSDAPLKTREDLVCITYNDVVVSDGKCFDRLNKSFKVAFFDRVDMYTSQLPVKRIKELSKSTIILLDCKHIKKLDIQYDIMEFSSEAERIVINHDIFV